MTICDVYNSKNAWGCFMLLSVLGLAYCLLMQDFVKKGYDKDYPSEIQNQLKENARIAGLSEVGFWYFSTMSTLTYLMLLISKEPLFESNKVTEER